MSAQGERLARVEEALNNIKAEARSTREESRLDRSELLTAIKELQQIVGGLSQNVSSTAAGVAQLNLEKCGERLTAHDQQFAALDTRLARADATSVMASSFDTRLAERINSLELWRIGVDKTLMESRFVRHILGGGALAIWRFVGAVLGSSLITAAFVHYIWH